MPDGRGEKIFRQPELKPHHSAIVFSHNKRHSKDIKGIEGHCRINLCKLIKHELKFANFNFDKEKEVAKTANLESLKK